MNSKHLFQAVTAIIQSVSFIIISICFKVLYDSRFINARTWLPKEEKQNCTVPKDHSPTEVEYKRILDFWKAKERKAAILQLWVAPP